jgi:hypothetical protein
MYPAAKESLAGMLWVTGVFGVVTILTDGNRFGSSDGSVLFDRYDKIFDRSFNRCYQLYYKKTV